VTLTEQAAALLTAAGVLAGAVGTLASDRLRVALRVTLDLWAAAGLLLLTADRSWSVLALAAGLVAIRQVVARTLLSDSDVPR
jgi:hypothetical protein